ncbi:hypothetical protein BT93_F0511 [Corymbia citriodora subsp. variegata]|nr:hypothetical protein BT93_F0511 [Corymbia citriodora subsp. variegata]
MARYVDSGYGTQYGRAATPPTYDGYDRSYGSHSAKGGVVGDTWRVPQGTVVDNNNYRRDEIDAYGRKPYTSPAPVHGYGSSGQVYRPSEYGSSGQVYRPSEYGDHSGNEDWRKSGGDNYRGGKDEFHYKERIAMVVPTVVDGYVAPRPGHGTGSLTKPTTDIGTAIELLRDQAALSSASGGYPQPQQVEARYSESVSTVHYYPEIMPHTMDPTKRYGNISLGSRRPAVAETGRTYY